MKTITVYFRAPKEKSQTWFSYAVLATNANEAREKVIEIMKSEGFEIYDVQASQFVPSELKAHSIPFNFWIDYMKGMRNLAKAIIEENKRKLEDTLS